MNMKTRKLLASILAGTMALSLLAGCSGDTPPANSQSGGQSTTSLAPNEPNGASDPVEIVWAGWSGEEEATKDIFQRMMDTYESASGNNVTWVG